MSNEMKALAVCICVDMDMDLVVFALVMDVCNRILLGIMVETHAYRSLVSGDMLIPIAFYVYHTITRHDQLLIRLLLFIM